MTNATYYDSTPIGKVIDIYNKSIDAKNMGFCEWLNMEHKKIKTVYYWECKSDDGCYHNMSTNHFSNQKDCYNDMLKASSQKIVWNVEWEDVIVDIPCIDENKEYISGSCGIMHHTEYLPNKIVHYSYSGEYVWEIKTKEIEA